MDPIASDRIRLRDVALDDLPKLYEYNLDPESNRLAATIPRSAAAFETHWKNVLADSSCTAKVILVDNRLAGSISCFQHNSIQCVGYWIVREFWGQGIASRALELLLTKVTIRPLHADVATSNPASLRVLQKCGFVVRSVQIEPTTERFLECEIAHLVLE